MLAGLATAWAQDLAALEAAHLAEARVQPTAERWNKLGLVRHLRNRFTEAIPAFEEAIRLDPALWTSHLFLGICRYRTNQFAPALASLREAQKRAPAGGQGRDEIDFWLGATRIALKQPLDGLQDIERLLRRQPNHIEALQLAARAYADTSSALWNGVAEKRLETPPGWEVHARVLESEGDTAGALDAYRQSLALDPRRHSAAAGAARILLTQGKAAEALAMAKPHAALDANAAMQAAMAAIQLARHAEAVGFLQLPAKDPVRFPDALLALTQEYMALKDNAGALAAARRAVAASPGSQAAHELLVAALEQSSLAAEAGAERKRWSARGR